MKHHCSRFPVILVMAAMLATCGARLVWAGNLFSGPINSPAGGAWGLAAGDFDGDGTLDLIVTNANSIKHHSQVKVLLGKANGRFQTPVGYKVGYQPFSVASGDLNGDGKPDLAVANTAEELSVLLNNGDGTFQPQTRLKAGDNPHRVAVGDFNRDGNLDIVVAGRYKGVSVLLGNGDGTSNRRLRFQQAATLCLSLSAI